MSTKEAIVEDMSTKGTIVDDRPVGNEDNFKGGGGGYQSGSEVTVMEIEDLQN